MGASGPSGQQGGNSSSSRKKAKKDLEVSGAEKYGFKSQKKDKANVGKYELNNYEVKDIPFAPGISGFTRDLRQKQFEVNRKFFQEKVLTSKNRGGYTNTMDSYSSYMKNRLSNKTDAYGNKLNLNTGQEVEKDPMTAESREAAGRSNARSGYGPAVEIYGKDGNRYVEGALNIGLEKPGSTTSEETKTSDKKYDSRRTKKKGRSMMTLTSSKGVTDDKLTLGKKSLLGS
jgi:hypothetical protein